MARDFVRAGAAPSAAAGWFLRQVTARALDERVFDTVLGPDFDRRHANRLHLEVGRRWRQPRLSFGSGMLGEPAV